MQGNNCATKLLLAPLGDDILAVTRTSIALRPAAILTDIDALENALASGDDDAAIGQLAIMGTKPILDQLDQGEGFNQWLAQRRENADERLRRAIEQRLAALDQAGDGAAHTRLQTAWLARAPGSIPIANPAVPSEKTRIAVLPFRSMGAKDGQDYLPTASSMK
ncbi:MAG: hypothetical protein HC788_08070 [Sphingopyxis sp.]|nr:hypothetical protein [Sphingopyxis sp.]